MSYTDLTLKMLFGLSGNICAFPDCDASIIDTTYRVVVGQICHIKGKSPNGPRYDPNQSEEERNDYKNLILMCAAHNKIVDDEKTRDRFPIELLTEYKEKHESQCQNSVVGDNQLDTFLSSFSVTGLFITTHNQSGGQNAHQITNIYQAPTQPQYPITSKEVDLLRAALGDEGYISLMRTDLGSGISIQGKSFADKLDPSFAAAYIDAFEMLQKRNLVRHEGNSLYVLTGAGFEFIKEFNLQEQTKSQPKRDSSLNDLLIVQELAERKRNHTPESVRVEVDDVKNELRRLIEEEKETYDKLGISYLDVGEQGTLQHKKFFASVYWVSQFANSLDNTHLYMVFRKQNSSIEDKPLKEFQYLPDIKHRKGDFCYGWKYSNSSDAFLISKDVAEEILKNFRWLIRDDLTGDLDKYS